MGHEFELTSESEVIATPEEVWAAIATGPGIDSWFMGRTEVESGVGGAVRTAFAEYTPDAPVTVWDPLERLVYGTEPAADGRFVAYEFLIEGRRGGSTVLRTVTSGFLPGDDWADEFEAMTTGMELFFRTLVEYLAYFAGRAASPVTAFGPPVADWDKAWFTLGVELGLDRRPVAGDLVRARIDERTAVEGVVYFANADTVGIRTTDALYRFLRGFGGPMVAGHHLFAPDQDAVESDRTWQAWLGRVFG
ncbi:SRPBCC family protein [Amycolatopsis sp. H20-H5]|uniref:SRPBCC family protein n=1 Tax=Amycolatopsis sp. H20-H5 TaxID=3046309 RepID=UPI002DC00F46|nr:SRPBCC domain-containing protein [Amycolatopsis sp. H20-H5]MEC3976860.1 SRPBCC domain-containing protein [Amycolatopsis sp. H20-H5]